MNILEKDIIEKFEHRFRVNLINSLLGPRSFGLIGTIDSNRMSNLAAFSSLFHLGANPALIGMIVRPDSARRHTLENIIETGFYTINLVSESFFENAHQTSARYDKEVSEFKACGLGEVFINDFKAPFVKESKVQIALKLREYQKLEVNETILVIGEIEFIKVDKNLIKEDGSLNYEKLDLCLVQGLDTYFSLGPLKAKLKYAKP